MTGKLHNQTLDALATERLRSDIIYAVIPPGERLTEVGLSETLGVSRGTIRSALHHLTHENLVVYSPYSGWRAAPLTSEDAWEIYTLRAAIEGMAANLFQPIDRQVNEVRAAWETFQRTVAGSDAAAVTNADLNLHLSITAATGNARMLSHHQVLCGQASRYVQSCNNLIGERGLLLAQHEQIVDPLLLGQLESAAALAQDHCLSEGQELVTYLNATTPENMTSGSSRTEEVTNLLGRPQIGFSRQRERQS